MSSSVSESEGGVVLKYCNNNCKSRRVAYIKISSTKANPNSLFTLVEKEHVNSTSK